ncbi:MAG: prepilin-type N-terminal cleavage/methylation domain-containing protein [Candidatus Falkowbacteria bacterium]|nr:prepilin-type N-terminal cleavage/methylation domain-containing protein [Candidatus Falkowbacteria bacterium]
MKKQTKGFTLIELLVVIAIIGLLATLSVVALNTARVKARDARRLADIRQMQSALEMYYSDFNQYPTGTLVANASLSAAGFGTSPSGSVYLAKVPTNPTPVNDGACSGSPSYAYLQQNSGTSYILTYCHSVNGNSTATPAGYK